MTSDPGWSLRWRGRTSVTATARDLDGLARFDFPPQVAPVELDVSDPESCRAAFEQAAAQSGNGGSTEDDPSDGKSAPAANAAGDEAAVQGQGGVAVAYFLARRGPKTSLATTGPPTLN